MMVVMRCACSLVIAAAFAVAIPSASAQTLAPSFEDSVAIGGLDTPVALAFAPTGEVFVAEKTGLVKEFAPLPSPGPGTIVLDLRAHAPIGLVAPVWNDSCGGAGQPNPTAPGGGCVASGRLARYR